MAGQLVPLSTRTYNGLSTGLLRFFAAQRPDSKNEPPKSVVT